MPYAFPKNRFIGEGKDNAREAIWRNIAAAMVNNGVTIEDAHVLCLPDKGLEIPFIREAGFSNIWMCDHSPQKLAYVTRVYGLERGRSYGKEFEEAMRLHSLKHWEPFLAVHFDSCANVRRAVKEATAIFRHPVTTNIVWLAITCSKGRGEPGSVDFQRMAHMQKVIEQCGWSAKRIAAGRYRNSRIPMLWCVFECRTNAST